MRANTAHAPAAPGVACHQWGNANPLYTLILWLAMCVEKRGSQAPRAYLQGPHTVGSRGMQRAAPGAACILHLDCKTQTLAVWLLFLVCCCYPMSRPRSDGGGSTGSLPYAPSPSLGQMGLGTNVVCQLGLLLLLQQISHSGSTVQKPIPEKLVYRKFFGSLGIRHTYNAYAACTRCFFPLWPPTHQVKDKLRLLPLPDLSNKWIYFYGDSTLRQLYKSAMNVLRKTETTSEDMKLFVRSQCDLQSSPDGRALGQRFYPFRAPMGVGFHCQVNERTCHKTFGGLTAMGTNVTITFDWKHLAYEDYDRMLLDSMRTRPKPDLFIASFGIHDCGHYPEDYEYHRRQIFKFAQHLAAINASALFVDATPFASRKDAEGLNCETFVNMAIHATAVKFGYHLFSRFSFISSADLGAFAHQPDRVVDLEGRLLLAYMSHTDFFGPAPPMEANETALVGYFKQAGQAFSPAFSSLPVDKGWAGDTPPMP